MKPLPELLNMLSLKYASLAKPVSLLLVASLVGLIGVYFFGRETGLFHGLTLFFTYGLFQTFFLLSILFGFRKLKSENLIYGWPYVAARAGEWINGAIVLVCSLLPTPLFIYLLMRWLSGGL